MMGYRAKTPLVMHISTPEQLDYAWLVPGLCDCLLVIDQIVRARHQHDDVKQIVENVQKMIGALEMIGEYALHAALKKMRDAIAAKPALATWMTTQQSQVIRGFLYAVMAYLENIRSGGAPSILYTYPYYYAMMTALDAKHIHPADLYYAQCREKLVLVEKDVLEEARPRKTMNFASLKSDFEKEFRLYMQNFGVTNKERVHINAMHRFIGSVVDAQESMEGRAFWGIVLAFSEGMTQNKMTNDVYVRALYVLIADYLRGASIATIVLDKTIMAYALFFIAHVAPEEESVVEKIKALYQMPAVRESDYKQVRYRCIDPVLLANLKDKLGQLNSIWNGVVEGIPQYEKTFVKATEGLREQGELLGSPDVAELFNILRRSALPIVRNRSEHSVKLEVTRYLLFVEATLYNIYRLPANFSQLVQDAALRLASSLSKKYVTEQLLSLKKMTGDEHYTKTTMIVADEMLSHLQQLEALLQQLLMAPGERSHLRNTTTLLDNLESICLMLNFKQAHLAMAHAKQMIVAMCDDVFDRKKLWCMMNNLGVLSFFAREIRNMSYLANDALLFDAATGMLMLRSVKNANVQWQSHPDNYALHCAPLLAQSHIEEHMLLEGDDSALAKLPVATDSMLDSFLFDLDGMVEDVACILPLSKIAPEDMGHIDTLQQIFHTMENKSRMAGIYAMSDAALDISYMLNSWVADNKSGSQDLYLLLDHAQALVVQWLNDMRLQGQSTTSFTLLSVASNGLQRGEPVLKKGRAR